jgi:ribonuclease HI
MSDVILYTDGGCRGNPGPGGWGFLAINPITGNALERCGGERETTNNRMELSAAINGLKSMKKPGLTVALYSDSQYVIKSATEWMAGWKRRGWKKADGPLKNVDLLKELDAVAARFEIDWKWVKGHAGDPGNEAADALTNRAMDAVQAGRDPAWEQRLVWR